MAGLADWLEDYRNWRGRQEWEQGKGWQDFFGGDPRAQEQFEKLSGFGTDAGGLVGMIKASHGSPHAFTKFDFSKIGTGEGAQAYGHGGYFAQGFDSPVAQKYAEDIGTSQYLRDNQFDANGKPNRVFQTAFQIDAGVPNDEIRDGLSILTGHDPDSSEITSIMREAQKLFSDRKNTNSHLYNVELRWPDAAREAADPLGEHHLLDWDAPLSEQNQKIKDLFGLNDSDAAFKDWYAKRIKESGLGDDYLWDKLSSNQKGSQLRAFERQTGLSAPASLMVDANKISGEQAYNNLSELYGDAKAASEHLRHFGIPGIRYLDQASRGAGQGTRNYVMFDDALANIVSRNGVSLSDLLRR